MPGKPGAPLGPWKLTPCPGKPLSPVREKFTVSYGIKHLPFYVRLYYPLDRGLLSLQVNLRDHPYQEDHLDLVVQ
jgi:hypothetical protein